MIAAFLLPVDQITDSLRGGLQRVPQSLALIRTAPGYIGTKALGVAGNSYTLMAVNADDFTAINALPGVVQFGSPQATFAQIVASLDGVSINTLSPTRRSALRSRLLTLGVSEDSGELGPLLRRIMLKLEPAANTDDAFERTNPSAPQTIIESFGGTLANWSLTLGSAWTITAGEALPTTATQNGSMRRIESAFPNDQYAQCKCEGSVGTGKSYSSPLARGDGSGNGYWVQIDSITLWSRVSGVNTYLTETAFPAFVAGQLYTVKINCIGTTISVDVDGVNKSSTTSSSITSGKPGVFEEGGTGDPFAVVDDFECTDATSSETYPAGYSRGRFNPLIRM